MNVLALPHRVPNVLWRSRGLLRGAVDSGAIAVLVGFVLMAVIGPIFAEGRTDPDLTRTFRPPLWSGGSPSLPLGTDQLGRDIFARLLQGSQISLMVAIAAVGVAAVVGTLLGMVAGFYGRWADAVVSRIIDAQLSLPYIILALVLVTVVGPNLVAVILLIASTTWVPFARVIRAEVLVLRESDFVALARVAALADRTLLSRHILPHLLPSVLVLLSLDVGKAILAEASLSFLGVGVQPPLTSWGLMIAESRGFMQAAPWVVGIPAVALALLALSANAVGDHLRDRLDPTLSIVD